MIKILVKNNKFIDAEQLGSLFKSVNWNSGRYPELLQKAIAHHNIVYTVWDNEKLVGLVSGLDDGVLNAYIMYLLVNPNYQGKGIGTLLLNKIKEYYSKMIISIIASNESVGFYSKNKFFVNNKGISMYKS